MQRRFEFSIREASGALGDLGTLLPLMLGAIAVGGLSSQPVILGFAVFYIATALVYRLPVPVQPMKAVAAVLLIGGATPAAVALSGVLIGLVLIVLSVSGLATRLARLVPQSVLAGLQLGLGVALGLVALKLLQGAPLFALVGLAALAAMLWRGWPAAILFLGGAVLAGAVFDLPGLGVEAGGGVAFVGLPAVADVTLAVNQMVLPQLSLTLMNAVVLTSLIAGDCFKNRAARVTPKRLALTSGVANLVLAPFGALPMCHGAGGVTAHHRFGARTGGAPLMLGAGLLVLALVPGAMSALGAVPAAALGALLMVAAVELAAQKRIVDCMPSCRPVIGVTAAVTVLVDPFFGLVTGTIAEMIRVAVVRRLMRRAS